MNNYLYENDYHLPSLRDGLNLDAVLDHMEGVLDAVYVTGNISSFENSLEELCAHLGIRYKPGKVLIQGSTVRGLEYQLGYQRALLDKASDREKQ